MRYAVTTKMIL